MFDWRRLLQRFRELGPIGTLVHLLRKYAVELALTALAYLLLYKAFELEGLQALFGGIKHHAIVLALAIVLGQVFRIFPIWTEVSLLIEQHRKTPKAVRRPLGRFLRHRVEGLQLARDRVLTKTGLILDRDELEHFVDACFNTNAGRRYIGTDSHPPTDFYSLYRTYLNEQIAFKSSKQTWDFRILFATESELAADCTKDAAVFEEFVDRHLREHVHLLQVDRITATSLAGVQRFPSTDLGIFGWEFVAFYKPIRRRNQDYRYQVHLWPIDDDIRRRLCEYLTMLNKHSREIHLEQRRVRCDQRTENAERDHLSAMLRGGVR